jgi:hypothetical protein
VESYLEKEIFYFVTFTCYRSVGSESSSSDSDGVQIEERKKGKKHQVFRLSFDAKEVSGDDEIVKVLDYMHHNPVSGKWELVEDFVDYPYSSARYYELGEQ